MVSNQFLLSAAIRLFGADWYHIEDGPNFVSGVRAVPQALFGRLSFILCEGEALRLSAASRSFLGVVSAFAVSHKP